MGELPRTALERVLARASELQTSNGDPAESISESRLLEIAGEVGLDPQYVRQAMAEERARVSLAEHESGRLLSSLGPAVLSAQRTVPGTPSALLGRLETSLPSLELMIPVRRTSERLILEARRDTVGNFLRSLGVGGRRYDFVRLDQLVVTATPVDANRSVLRFDALVSGVRRAERSSALVLGGMLFVLAAAVSIPMVVFALMVPVWAMVTSVLLAIIAAAGSVLTWRGIKRRFRSFSKRVETRMEFLLDEAQQGRIEQPRSLLDRVLKAGDNWG